MLTGCFHNGFSAIYVNLRSTPTSLAKLRFIGVFLSPQRGDSAAMRRMASPGEKLASDSETDVECGR